MEVTIIQGNSERIQGTTVPMWGLGEVGRVTKLELQIGDWDPPIYSVVLASIGQYILGMDILWSATLEIIGTCWAFGTTQCLHARVITVGLVQQEAEIPRATEIVNIKHCKFPQGDAEIQATVNDLLQAGVFCCTHSPFNSPVWPVKKRDGSWQMTVDYRAVNKKTPSK